MNKKIYKKLAQMAYARLRCIESIKKNIDNSIIENKKTWIDKYEDEIDNIMQNIFPHGSGIDNGCTFNFEKSINNKLVINSSYHCMDQYGSYDGWIDFIVILTPDLELDYTLNIKGSFGKYGHIKDYLYDLFHKYFDTIYGGGR